MKSMFDVVNAINVCACFSRSHYVRGGDGKYRNAAKGDEARIRTISHSADSRS